MNPKRYRKFLIYLSRSLGVNVEVKAVFAVRRFVTIAPFCSVSSRVVNSLISRMSERIGHKNALPRNYRLRSFPSQLTDRWSGIRDTLIGIDSRIVAKDTLHLTSFNGQHRTGRL